MSFQIQRVALAALLALLVPSSGAASVKGDLNADGVVDLGDLPILARHVGGVASPPLTAAQLAAADVSPTSEGGDGRVDSADLLLFVRALLFGEDVDGDGLAGETGTTPFSADSDGDGLCDAAPVAGVCSVAEAALGTDPTNADSDGDGLCDGPLRAQPLPTSLGTCRGGEDLDQSGSSQGETSPTQPDSDGDGLCDGPDQGDRIVPGAGPVPFAVLCTRGEDLNADGAPGAGETDPRDADSDGDLVLDGDETDSDGDGRSDRREVLSATLALDPDTDNDGICDGSATAAHSDPNGPGCAGGEDTDGDGVVDFAESDPRSADSDGDGLADGGERTLGTNARDADSDRDYVLDGAELAAGTSPLSTDSDADGLADGVELALGSDPLDPQSGEADGYGSLRSYGGDDHVHSGSPAGAYAQTQSGYDPNCFDCPSVWCDRMYTYAREAGYDWVVSTNHEGADGALGLFMSPQILNWWKTVGPNYSNPAHPMDVYPTNPAGFPLYDGSGGHTDDQIESLASCAEAATEDGEFVAFFGIEYTAAPATSQGCLTASIGCGGHKTVIFPRLRNKAAGEQSCTGVSSTWPYDDQCKTLGQLYDAVAANGGVVAIAHPNFGPEPGLDLFAETASGDNGGIDPTLVMAAEQRDSEPELTPGLEHTYHNGIEPPGLNIGGILARGYRVHPLYGSDAHFKPTVTSWAGAGHADHAGECWAANLTKTDLLDAMRAHRCYFGLNGIQVRLTIQGTIMGSSLASSAVNPQQGIRVRVFARGVSAALGMNKWFLMKGKVQNPIVAPAQVPLASGVANCNPSGGAAATQLCVKDVHITLPGAATAADYEGFYYVIIRRGTTEVAVTAPVWVDPPSP